MTDPPTPEELVAARKVAHSAVTFQIAAIRFSSAEDAELVFYAREYVKRMRAHQRAVDKAHEAFKESP